MIVTLKDLVANTGNSANHKELKKGCEVHPYVLHTSLVRGPVLGC